MNDLMRRETPPDGSLRDFAKERLQRNYPGMTQARNECHGLPLRQRYISDQALSTGTASVRSQHVGADCGLVDEHQSCRVKEPLLTNPASTRPSRVGLLLFCRSQAFF
jgi:hypothetical protein